MSNSTSTHHPLGIGIDTGGTYTDSVLVDLRTHQVLKAAKCPTTPNDLNSCVAASLNAVLSAGLSRRIELIALSTTLATNALVQNRGADVGLIVIGRTRPYVDLPVVSVKYVDGGHHHTGQEIGPLDMERLLDHVAEFKGQVDAYGVCSEMSIVNPIHEKVAAKAIELMDPKPVFCSHRVSTKPGLKERCATAVLHARLMPVIGDFIAHTRRQLQGRGLTAGVLMVRGDASAIPIDGVEHQAAATVASGPAASAFYGAAVGAAARALVIDVGGTTTDISLVVDGRPVISSLGSRIGKYHTHVDSVEMVTVGIGGDSLVRIEETGQMEIGPNRVKPLALAPEAAEARHWLGPGARSMCIAAVKTGSASPATPQRLLDFLEEAGAATPWNMREKIGIPDILLDREVAELIFKNRVVGIGFTPTDAMHVLGFIRLGDTARSIAGAEVLCRLTSQSAVRFCQNVIRFAQQKIISAILEYLFEKQSGVDLSGRVLMNSTNDLIRAAFTLNMPIIGLGAASKHLLPGVADQLNTRVIFPPNYEVGNALGAIRSAWQSEVACEPSP